MTLCRKMAWRESGLCQTRTVLHGTKYKTIESLRLTFTVNGDIINHHVTLTVGSRISDNCVSSLQPFTIAHPVAMGRVVALLGVQTGTKRYKSKLLPFSSGTEQARKMDCSSEPKKPGCLTGTRGFAAHTSSPEQKVMILCLLVMFLPCFRMRRVWLRGRVHRI